MVTTSSDPAGASEPVLSHESTSTFYDRISRFYDFLSEHDEGPVREQAIDLLDVHPGENVLEIGVGTGHGLVRLARAVSHAGWACGIDLSPGMLKIAAHHLAAEGLQGRAALVRADATTIPFAAGCIDRVLLCFTLELFEEPEIDEVLLECRRVLRQQGKLAVASLSREGPDGLPRRAYDWLHRHFPGWVDCRPIFVARSLEAAGFTVDSRLIRMAGLPVELAVGMKP